mgnify:CR=1 FL=1
MNFKSELAVPIIYKGIIYIGSNDGRLYALEEETGKETGFFQATERITSPVVVDENGKLLVTKKIQKQLPVKCTSKTMDSGTF